MSKRLHYGYGLKHYQHQQQKHHAQAKAQQANQAYLHMLQSSVTASQDDKHDECTATHEAPVMAQSGDAGSVQVDGCHCRHVDGESEQVKGAQSLAVIGDGAMGDADFGLAQVDACKEVNHV